MSDTPRTDGCLTEILDAYGFVHQGNCPQRWVNHARELERELNAANQIIRQQQLLEEENLRLTAKVAQLYEGAEEQKLRIKRLEEFVDQLTNPKFTRDDLPKEALLQYIKRLEEAGDAMMSEPCEYTFEQWIKAKEDKQ